MNLGGLLKRKAEDKNMEERVTSLEDLPGAKAKASQDVRSLAGMLQGLIVLGGELDRYSDVSSALSAMAAKRDELNAEVEKLNVSLNELAVRIAADEARAGSLLREAQTRADAMLADAAAREGDIMTKANASAEQITGDALADASKTIAEVDAQRRDLEALRARTEEEQARLSAAQAAYQAFKDRHLA